MPKIILKNLFYFLFFININLKKIILNLKVRTIFYKNINAIEFYFLLYKNYIDIKLEIIMF